MSFTHTVLPYIISGISVGGQYALIAIGYTMVYGILRLINFAHGDVFMVAGLMMVYLAAALPLYVAIPLMILLTVLLGFLIERVAYKPLRTAPRDDLRHRRQLSAAESGPVCNRRPEQGLSQDSMDFRSGGLVRHEHHTGDHHHPVSDHYSGGPAGAAD